MQPQAARPNSALKKSGSSKAPAMSPSTGMEPEQSLQPPKTEEDNSQPASLSHLKELRAEAEDRMNYLNKEIEKVSARLADVEEMLVVDYGSASQVMGAMSNRSRESNEEEDAPRRHERSDSNVSKVTFRLPDEDDEDEDDENGAGKRSRGASSADSLAAPSERKPRRNSSAMSNESIMSSAKSEFFDQYSSVSMPEDHRQRIINFQAMASAQSSINRRRETVTPGLTKEREEETQRLLPQGPTKPANTKRCTLFEQTMIASQLSLTIRIFGLALAFITVVFTWETADLVMELMFPRKEIMLIAYIGLAVTAAALLALSHEWVMHSAATGAISSLVPSFAYALSTLFMAIGTWGIVSSVVEVLVPKQKRLFLYSALALFSFIGTVCYGYQTRHNVLLDIASCATTMGLHDETEFDV